MDFMRGFPVPFYMAHGEDATGIWRKGDSEEEALRDYGYLQNICPICIREYQEKIASILDKLDYEGSMIYDEYPDKFSMMHMAKSVASMVKALCTEEDLPKEEDLMQVLVCDEIYKRRLAMKKKDAYGISTRYPGIFE